MDPSQPSIPPVPRIATCGTVLITESILNFHLWALIHSQLHRPRLHRSRPRLPQEKVGRYRGNAGGKNTQRYKNQIAGETEPLDQLHRFCSEKLRSSRMPVSVSQDIRELEYAAREKVRDDHEYQSDVQSPERNTNIRFDAIPLFVVQNLTEGKNHKANGEHPENPHHCRVTMVRREHGPDFKITHDR